MLQLVYASRADETWDGNLRELCEQSARNNERDEITGVLLHQDGAFLQVLEGPKLAVEDTFIRIITDPRHHLVALLSRRMLTRREFGDWAMVGLTCAAERQATINRVAAIVADEPTGAVATFKQHFLPSA